MENNSCEEIWIVKHNLYEFEVASASPYEMKVRLEVCVYREENSLDTYLQSSLSCETVALIFVAITLIRQKHTDGAVSQTLRLRIKMSSLPTLDMQRKKSWQIFPHSHQFYFPFFFFSFFNGNQHEKAASRWWKRGVFSSETMVLGYHMPLFKCCKTAAKAKCSWRLARSQKKISTQLKMFPAIRKKPLFIDLLPDAGPFALLRWEQCLC